MGNKKCDYCKTVLTRESHLVCKTCREAVYCGKECQTKAWPVHKTICVSQETIEANMPTREITQEIKDAQQEALEWSNQNHLLRAVRLFFNAKRAEVPPEVFEKSAIRLQRLPSLYTAAELNFYPNGGTGLFTFWQEANNTFVEGDFLFNILIQVNGMGMGAARFSQLADSTPVPLFESMTADQLVQTLRTYDPTNL